MARVVIIAEGNVDSNAAAEEMYGRIAAVCPADWKVTGKGEAPALGASQARERDRLAKAAADAAAIARLAKVAAAPAVAVAVADEEAKMAAIAEAAKAEETKPIETVK